MILKKNNQSFIEPGNLGAERLTGVRILILTICMKVKGCERKLLRTASLEQNKGWPGLQLTAAYVVMTMGCTRVRSKIWKYNCDIRSVVSTKRSPISVCSYKELHVLHSWTCSTEAGSYMHTQTQHYTHTYTGLLMRFPLTPDEPRHCQFLALRSAAVCTTWLKHFF